MTLQQLRDFLAVIEHGSFRSASRALGVSQAGLTNSVKALESSLGVQLMSRTSAGVELTVPGTRVSERAELILAEAARTRDDISQHLNSAAPKSVKVGLSLTATALVPHIVPDYRQSHPSVDLHLSEGLSHQLLPDVLQGKLDFACLALSQAVGKELKQTPLFSASLCVIARQGHRLIASTSLADFVDECWILLGPPGAPGASVLRYFDEAGLGRPKTPIYCNSFAQVAAIVANTDSLALVPRLALKSGLLGAAVVPCQVATPQTYELYLVQRAEVALTPMASDLARMFISFSRTLAPRMA